MSETERTIFELTDRVARLEKALVEADDRLRALEPCPKHRPDLAVRHATVFENGALRCYDCGVRIWPRKEER